MVPLRIYAQASTTSALDQKKVVDFLNETIDWYQDRTAQQRIATEPGDAFFFDSNRQIADQIVHLSFDFARAKAELIGNHQQSAPPRTTNPDYRNITETAARLETQIAQMRSRLGEEKKTLARLPRSQRKGAESTIAGLQSQLDLLLTQQETVRTILQFIGGTSEPVSLASRIDALERTIPQNQAALSGSVNGGEATAANRVRPGLWGVLSRIFELLRKAQTVKSAIRETNQLSERVKQMQVPLRKQAFDLARQSESTETPQKSQDPAVLAAQKSALDVANNHFKVLAAAFLPLSKQTVLLEAYQKNLENWLAAIKSERSSELKDLLLRLLGLGLLLGIVLSLFEVWRRTIVRYVSDLGKRYQFLVMRRIAMVAVITLIIVLTFLNALGSLATFAGLMTAGVAVALQNVFLAIVGYFILIGKFGVRVGDRVQIGDMKGEVVEIGMLRLHALEIDAMEADPQPTGRLVALSNSVVFQPSIGFIKQVPGSTLIWHEINFTVAPESDFRTVEQRTYSAVDRAFKEYQGDIERLRSRMEKDLKSVSITSLQPSVHFRVTPAGIEVHLRFPADQRRAAEIDDRFTRELVCALAAEPKLRILEAEGSGLRQRIDAYTDPDLSTQDHPQHA
jgi:small-conductance mechanosensitive channel